ncbi:hypothetical protein O9992_06300 [Vibrio lentus]|nr:hypothetical protein [Vibrio lentus]
MRNDDGVHAQRIHELANELRDLAEIIIVAIFRTVIARVLHKTANFRTAFYVAQENTEDTYSVQGTPTDCVHHFGAFK